MIIKDFYSSLLLEALCLEKNYWKQPFNSLSLINAQNWFSRFVCKSIWIIRVCTVLQFAFSHFYWWNLVLYLVSLSRILYISHIFYSEHFYYLHSSETILYATKPFHVFSSGCGLSCLMSSESYCSEHAVHNGLLQPTLVRTFAY